MRSFVIGEETVEIAGVKRVLEYAVLVSSIYGERGKFIGESYGARVRLTHGHGQSGLVDWKAVPSECGRVLDLTTRHTEILAFIELIRRNRVTPSTLHDVASDCLPLSSLIPAGTGSVKKSVPRSGVLKRCAAGMARVYSAFDAG